MKKIKKYRPEGIDDVRLEMLAVDDRVGIWWTKILLNTCMSEGEIQEERRTGLIVPVWKRKGDVHDPGKYRGITLLSHNVEVAGQNPGWHNTSSSKSVKYSRGLAKEEEQRMGGLP